MILENRGDKAQGGLVLVIAFLLLLTVVLAYYHIAIEMGIIEATLIIIAWLIASVVGGAILSGIVIGGFFLVCFILFGLPLVVKTIYQKYLC